MTTVVQLGPADVGPDRTEVLRLIGIPAGAEISERIEQLYGAAAEAFAATVAPAAVLSDVTPDEFAEVYRGDGKNEPDTPVAAIFPRAEHVALFAVTLGSGVSDALTRQFEAQDFALAYTLDAMASVAADAAAEAIERRWETGLRARGWTTPDGAALRYSPGYCGWDLTGQRRLFARLGPEAIGLTLTTSCLMQPLKSVSGVILAGPRTIHKFPPTYEFCGRCTTKTCRERLRAMALRTAVKGEK
jgi:hypothetical protein